MYMGNANLTPAYPTRTIFHCLSLGLTLGQPGFVLGLPGLALGRPGFLDTNMLVWAGVGESRANRGGSRATLCVGGLDQCEAPMRRGSHCGGI